MSWCIEISVEGWNDIRQELETWRRDALLDAVAEHTWGKVSMQDDKTMDDADKAKEDFLKDRDILRHDILVDTCIDLIREKDTCDNGGNGYHIGESDIQVYVRNWDLPRDDDGQLIDFTFPGGYTVVYYDKEYGDVLCPECARKMDNDHESWDRHNMTSDTYDEGPKIECSECHKKIESSYGIPDPEFNRMDICAAYRMYAIHYHNGQASPEYAIHGRLKAIGYTEGAYGCEYEDQLCENARRIYDRLVDGIMKVRAR